MKPVPFFPNAADGTCCFQAALQMVLGFFEERPRTLAEVEKISQKIPGQWTWPTATLLWLLNHNYEIKLIEHFDYSAFAKKGKKYLVDRYGQEVADAQEAHSDLAREQNLALEFAQHQSQVCSSRIPTLSDLGDLMQQGYLMICNVNAAAVYGLAGYSAHFVVPLAIEGPHIMLHDPGLPPKPQTAVTCRDFSKGWGYPTEQDQNLLAIRPRVANPKGAK